MKKYLGAVMLAVVLIIAGVMYYRNQGADQPLSVDQVVAEQISRKYNRSADVIQVGVTVDTGAFAMGSVRFEGEGGGAMWFAAMTGKGWELAYDGNGVIPCDAANAYSFPKDMVPQCIDTQNGNRLIER